MLGLKTRGGQPTGPARSEGDRRPETTAAAARPRAWPSAAGGRHAAQRQSLRELFKKVVPSHCLGSRRARSTWPRPSAPPPPSSERGPPCHHLLPRGLKGVGPPQGQGGGALDPRGQGIP